jgi:hypothetical protein
MTDSNTYWDQFKVVRGFDTVQDIYNIIAGRGFIAGSYAAFMATPHDTPILPNDVDIFATSNENALAIAEALSEKFQVPYTSNELVYSIENPSGGPAMPIQVVKPHPEWKDFPQDILNSFDMDISRAVLVGPEVVLADYNVGFLTGKLLRIANPLRSLKRVMKYHARGVEFKDGELIKLFLAWQQMSDERREEVINSTKEPAVVLGSYGKIPVGVGTMTITSRASSRCNRRPHMFP